MENTSDFCILFLQRFLQKKKSFHNQCTLNGMKQ